jgi:hypothetical protein
MKPSGNGGRPLLEINVTGAISAGLSWSLNWPLRGDLTVG